MTGTCIVNCVVGLHWAENDMCAEAKQKNVIVFLVTLPFLENDSNT